MIKKEIERFWSKVERKGADECWEWKGCCFNTGYGCATIEGKNKGAHRAAFEIIHGPIAPGIYIRHSCDNPPCCNPSHLLAGTPLDNMMDRKDRGHYASGDDHWSRKNPDKVARGENHWSKTKPHLLANCARGDTHYSRTRPELLARGERHGLAVHPERVPRGEGNGNSKLTDEKVREIRALLAEKLSHKEIARRYGVRSGTIGFIALGLTWKHVL